MTPEELITALTELPTWEEKYQTIIELGKELPAMDPADKNAQTSVPGCMSQIWIKIHKDGNGHFHFEGDSDAFIVKGFLALFFKLIEGKTAGQISSFDFSDIFNKIGLHDNLSPNRRNGLFVMERYLKENAK